MTHPITLLYFSGIMLVLSGGAWSRVFHDKSKTYHQQYIVVGIISLVASVLEITFYFIA